MRILHTNSLQMQLLEPLCARDVWTRMRAVCLCLQCTHCFSNQQTHSALPDKHFALPQLRQLRQKSLLAIQRFIAYFVYCLIVFAAKMCKQNAHCCCWWWRHNSGVDAATAADWQSTSHRMQLQPLKWNYHWIFISKKLHFLFYPFIKRSVHSTHTRFANHLFSCSLYLRARSHLSCGTILIWRITRCNGMWNRMHSTERVCVRLK